MDVGKGEVEEGLFKAEDDAGGEEEEVAWDFSLISMGRCVVVRSESDDEPSLLPRKALTWYAFSFLRCACTIALANSRSSGWMVCFPKLFTKLSISFSATSTSVSSSPCVARLTLSCFPLASFTVNTTGSIGAPSTSLASSFAVMTKFFCRCALSGTGRQNT